MARRAIVLGVAVVLLALAGAAAYFGREAREVESSIHRGDAAFRVEPVREGLWRTGGTAPGLKDVLAVDDELAYRRAARLYEVLRRRGRDPFDATARALRADAQFALARAEQTGLTREARSKTLNLNAILVLEEALGDFRNSGALVQRSLAGFRRAIRTDPANEEAMFNVELILRLLAPEASRLRLRYGVDVNSQRVAGAAAVRPGRGY
jgi:hypothetical protein